MEMQRLDKWLASQGTLSRRDVKELVRTGLVTVNGEKAYSPDMKLSGNETVFVKGELTPLKKHIYIMMNKPMGVLSATRDIARHTALELLPRTMYRPGLFPAGRLDKDTEGFLLITDDGEYAHKILSPKNHVPKTYLVRFSGDADTNFLAAEFSKGVILNKNDQTSPAILRIESDSPPGEAWLTIYEGMYHQVKRMFAVYGLTVTYLKRMMIGGLMLDPNLPSGGCREIFHNELSKIC